MGSLVNESLLDDIFRNEELLLLLLLLECHFFAINGWMEGPRWKRKLLTQPVAICMYMTNPEAIIINNTFIYFKHVLLPLLAPYVIQGTLRKAQMQKIECN